MAFDPFTIPHGTDIASANLTKLFNQNFSTTFRLEWGIPTKFASDLASPIISFNTMANPPRVVYQLTFKTFQIITFSYSGYRRSWGGSSLNQGRNSPFT